jgi:integrase
MPAPLVATGTPGIYRRGSRYVVRYRDPHGTPRQRSARTLAEARALRASFVADVARGDYRQLSRVTFADYASTWVETYTGRTSRGIRPETLSDYASELANRAVPHFGRKRLAEIEPRDLKVYATILANRGLKPATIRQAIAPVRALFATALEEGLIRINPATGLRLAISAPSDDEHDQAKALTEAELLAVLEATDARWRLFVEFVAHTGMRIGEAVAVRWSDVDFGKRRVHVRRRWYRGAFASPKSKYSVRAIPLTERMTEQLRQLREAAPELIDSALVFPNRDGRVLDPSNLRDRVLKPAVSAAGVSWAGWHTLRHTCGSMLFRHGANAKQVQYWLGHHSPAFTLAVYVHLLPEDAADPAFLDAVTRSPSNSRIAATPPVPPVGRPRASS